MNSIQFIFRKLEESDYHKNYLQLLSQLTLVGNISPDEFANIFGKIQSQIWVIEDSLTNKIVASASIFLEQKIIHGGGIVAHLEDVVVDQSYRGAQIGKKLIANVVEKARESGAYKIIADCKPELVSFYSKNGFEKKGEQIAIYFSH
jgi:glucosamine-phosphate N-acetyltransferase